MRTFESSKGSGILEGGMFSPNFQTFPLKINGFCLFFPKMPTETSPYISPSKEFSKCISVLRLDWRIGR